MLGMERGSAIKKCYRVFPEFSYWVFWGHSIRKEEGHGSRTRSENRERRSQVRTRKSQGRVCRVWTQAWQPSRSAAATPPSPEAGLPSQGLPGVLPPLLASAQPPRPHRKATPNETNALFTHRK